MHGREGEEPKRRWHMWTVPAFGTTVTAATDSFCKDGRKVSVGDCALFKPPQDTSPPFIGIIRWLTSGKEDYLKLGVNWLYRPADVKLGKGILLEAAPNEVFYSFHKDEIPAASLLHPCKVAFLRKGVELPSGISSFVCRRVYDTTNKCLWWLTDQDYINERQEEVDQLLDKTRLEMHAAVQSGGRSPKPLNGPASTQQLKPGSDSSQNNVSSFPSQVKGKKRERGDQISEPIKRERSLKTDDGDWGNFKPESMLKSEIAKITDRGGLVDYEGVEKLVQLMQPDKAEKKIDLAGRIMLAEVISATDRFECLGQFVQLRGLSILDEWLQEVHKGKVGDKENDKSVEDFLFALLRALDKLPVNLHALQTCNVGKSVNHLRSHKNLEIQKKARSLVDTWKKRVEAEMNNHDTKPGSNQAISSPTKPGPPEVSHGGNRRTSVSSEVPMKSSNSQPSAYKTTPVKLGHGDGIPKSTIASPGSIKLPVSIPASMGMSSKDSHSKVAVGSGTLDVPLTAVKEEKSSSSSQSQNNSQSYSSDHAKAVGSAWKEDARSSTAGSMNVNKASTGASRHRKSSNGILGSAVSGVQKETALSKSGSLNRSGTSEKVLQSGLTCERTLEMPVTDHGNSHRLIVRLPNPGRSPARSASGGSFDDPSVMVSRASSPGISEKHDQSDRKVKGKSDSCRRNVAADVNTESWQSNDVKDGFTGTDEGVRSPAVLDEERCRTGDGIEKPMETSKVSCSSSRNDKVLMSSESKSGKSHDASIRSINALIESCVKYSEAAACMPVGDDVGMNLLASVAAGEMAKSDLASPIGSPARNSTLPEDSSTGNDTKSRFSREDVSSRSEEQSDKGVVGDIEKQGNVDSEQLNTSCLDLEENSDPYLKSDGKAHERITAVSVVMSSADTGEEDAVGEGSNQLHEKGKTTVTGLNSNGVVDVKKMLKSPLLDENKKVDYVDEKILASNMKPTSNSDHGAIGDGCDTDKIVSGLKIENEVVEGSKSCQSLEMNDEKEHVQKQLIGGSSTDAGDRSGTEAAERCGDRGVCPDSRSLFNVDSDADFKCEKDEGVEVRTNADQREDKKVEQLIDVPPALDPRVEAGVDSVVSHHNDGDVKDKSDNKEVLEHSSGGPAMDAESPEIPVKEAESCMKSVGSKKGGVEGDETDECASTPEVSPSSVAKGLDVASKLDFDLNEGFPVDEGNQGESGTSTGHGCSSAVHLPGILSFPVSSMPSGLPAPITVAAAAKGPFLPPEHLLKSKGELRWKGSAATSAFRPAEPRKVLEMPLSTTDIPPDTTATKQGRPPLDIDLNVPDERVLEDMTSQSSSREISSESGLISFRALGRKEMLGSASAPVRNTGGLDLDLNRIDESSDIGQFSANTIRRLEVPLMPVGPSSSGGFPNGEVNVLRDFDLNNGPALDEVGAEPVLRSQHVKSNLPFLSPVTGPRMSSTELGSLSSWFPPGNSYPAVAIPSILPDRGEQPYPNVAAVGMQRILGPPTGGTTFGHDVYRGPVLSSSPAMAFSPNTTFPYPGFPFGTSYPLPSTSFSGGSTTYVDSSSGAGLCFPAVPSQLIGPTGAVSSQYPRPYVISLPDGSSNGGPESSRKWGRQGLDLNAGPGGTDIEGRDERLPSGSRQLSMASSHTLTEEQARMFQAAGGMLKRKEPEGGWDTERFSYKQQPSWQ
ncbi:Bromo adjacent homology (BAH) domain [Macleaya cordata]|uniref:Bromo adjacent homology (BAH) domain n=1 Tax=Macleaya cordata TaxID=56857 RepID=A0A200QLJ5_MACCD|nr:Bromo adjacent homology (BAH) domain [Macleaya cordata]